MAKKRATKRNANQPAKKTGGRGGARPGAGSPPGPRRSTLEFRNLVRQYDDEAVGTLVGLMRDSDNEWVKMAAVQLLLERGHGKPKLEITGPDDGPVRVEYRTYQEVRQALLEQGIDVERLPALNDPRNTDQLTIEHDKNETEH